MPDTNNYRFPVVQPETAEFVVRLPTFPNAPDGFHGSLDELLRHLRAEALSLDVLPLAPLVDQYLDYCKGLVENEDPSERISDFLPLAATLIHLKSRLLLPRQEALPADQPTVGEEIVEEICSEERRRRAQQQAAVGETEVPEDDGLTKLTLLDLMVLLNDVQSSLREPICVADGDLSVRDAIGWIRASLPGNTCLNAESYFSQCATPRDEATVFLALLELGKSQDIECYQGEAFAPLWLCRMPEARPVSTPHS